VILLCFRILYRWHL